MAKTEKKSVKKEKNSTIASLTSLGCAKNFVETEIAAASFLQEGIGLAAEGMENIRYINTCAFLKSARKEAAQHILAAGEWKKQKKGRMICVGGCLVAHTPIEELKKEFPFVDLFIGIDETAATGRILKKYMEKNSGKDFLPAKTKNFIYEHDTPRLQLTAAHYAYLKISDGCDNNCTYCLIPSIRGKLRSRKMESILQEAKNLLSSGVKELIIIAQDTSAYGKDLAGKSLLPELLLQLDKFEGDHLLRLMYLHPAGVTDELISVLKKMKHLVQCLEMPIQHIDDTVLKNMNRKIFEEDTKNVLLKLKKAGFALRTTFMTGFPGETEEAFHKVMELVREIQFQRLGVFAYSPEKGTFGAKMPGRPSAKTGEARRKAILEVQSKISEKYNKVLLGKKVEVIIDAPEAENVWVGRTVIDAPDIDNLVYVESFDAELVPGMRVKCLVKQISEYDILAEYIPVKNKKKSK